jgi:hypothetical protein
MSLAVGQLKIRDAYKELKMRYERAKEHWDDDARREFEEQFLSTLESKILTTMTGIGRLAEAFSAAQRECDPSRSS